jgi:hypothetical protein
MLTQIVNAYVEMSKHSPPVISKYVCKYCNKSYVRESTLTSHLCELKRRFQQEKEQGVQFGYHAYNKFYEFSQPGNKAKTYDDFVRSDFYIAFVKYGRYQVAIRTVNFASFTQWLLKNNKKLDYWTKEEYYTDWLKSYLQIESVDDALDRSFLEMQNYADHESQTITSFNNYFRNGSKNRIISHIQSGRISPWIVYNCASGIEFLDNLNEEQVDILLPYIDPDFWQKKFSTHKKDVDWLKTVLSEAGL